uniref:Uncharacterized protein n=1 Tax=Anguilla anguilla TaxID=7936 RepID=A0A0E9SDN3_ANGAN
MSWSTESTRTTSHGPEPKKNSAQSC